MPSRLANGAYRSGSRARTRRYRASCSRRASAACAAARPAASARCAGRLPWPAASCAAFPSANRFRRRRRWRAGPPRPDAAAPACPAPAAPLPGRTRQRPDRCAAPARARSGRWAKRPAGPRRAASVCMPARMRTTPAPCEASDSPVRACWPSKRGSAQATAWSISARPSASRPSPASCRQEASKGVGASGTGEADMTGKLGGLQGNDQNISTLYTSVCPH